MGSQESGIKRLRDRRQETGDRRQETGDRRQETGDRRQETGDRRQETGDRRLFSFVLPIPQFIIHNSPTSPLPHCHTSPLHNS